jgi:hypothetical protein
VGILGTDNQPQGARWLVPVAVLLLCIAFIVGVDSLDLGG